MWSLSLSQKTFGSLAVLGMALFVSFGLLWTMLCTTANDRTATDQSVHPPQQNVPVTITSWRNHHPSGNYRYVYEPSLMRLPPGVTLEHAHGIVVDPTDHTSLIITYKDQFDPTQCLLKWTNVSQVAEVVGKSHHLCRGVPHGLISAKEPSQAYNDNDDATIGVLYHANNEQALHKTDAMGEFIWSVHGKLQHNSEKNHTPTKADPYSPTWFAAPPHSPYLYLADGYGSNRIYVLNKFHGNYTGHSFGGTGVQHGQFQTCHSIAHDPRTSKNELVVCDRENHRLEYYKINPHDPSVFEYNRTLSFHPLLQRPCNLRTKGERAIVPFLEGSVAVFLDNHHHHFDVINITDTLGPRGFLHPHDAHFVPNTDGDFVVVTWNPGRIGYFKKVYVEEHNTAVAATDREVPS